MALAAILPKNATSKKARLEEKVQMFFTHNYNKQVSLLVTTLSISTICKDIVFIDYGASQHLTF